MPRRRDTGRRAIEAAQATATTRCRALSFPLQAVPARRRRRTRGVLAPALPVPPAKHKRHDGASLSPGTSDWRQRRKAGDSYRTIAEEVSNKLGCSHHGQTGVDGRQTKLKLIPRPRFGRGLFGPEIHLRSSYVVPDAERLNLNIV